MDAAQAKQNNHFSVGRYKKQEGEKQNSPS